jgi:hypothetical protein
MLSAHSCDGGRLAVPGTGPGLAQGGLNGAATLRATRSACGICASSRAAACSSVVVRPRAASLEGKGDFFLN